MIDRPITQMGIVTDHELTMREVACASVVPRRYEVETVTTRTDWAGDIHRFYTGHDETQHHVASGTRTITANVAVCRMADGSRRRVVTDEFRLTKGEPVLFVRHQTLGFGADDALRVFDRRWLTAINLPPPGNVPPLMAPIAAMLALMRGAPDLTAAGVSAAAFLITHAAHRVLAFLRTRLLIVSRRTANREAGRIMEHVG